MRKMQLLAYEVDDETKSYREMVIPGNADELMLCPPVQSYA